MKEKILFESIVGSKLYGTNSENSDTDIKGVFLPDINDLILCKAPKHYVESTGSKSERNDKDDVDKTYYSLQYFLELASKGDTNALDLLFAYTNKDCVTVLSSEFQYLIDNVDKIVTKNINAYLGYCKSQCVKYSLKGDKLLAYTKLKNILNYYIQHPKKDENGNWVTLEYLININSSTLKLDYYVNYEKGGKIVGQRAKILNNDIFGEHAYIVEMNNKEKYLMVSDMIFNFNETIVTTLHKVQRIIDSYGKRAEIAMENNGADYKAISHCVRVLYQVEDLLTTGMIHFPLKEAEFIKSIKYNTTDMNRDQIMTFIENKIKYIDEVLLPKSNLREKADYKWIEQFILNCYK